MEKLFNGDKLYMLPSVTPLQCMGFVLAGEGDVIAVDSGTQAEADELETLLLSLGGRVDMWFLTHGHFDHIEGLIETLERGKIAVGSIVYRFPPLDYIERVERNENRKARVADLERAIAARGVPVVRPEKGKAIAAGHFRVLPLSDGSAVGETLNPSSVVYRVDTRGESVLFLADARVAVEQRYRRRLRHGSVRDAENARLDGKDEHGQLSVRTGNHGGGIEFCRKAKAFRLSLYGIIIHPQGGWYYNFGHSPNRNRRRISALMIDLPVTHFLLVARKWVFSALSFLLLCPAPLS